MLMSTLDKEFNFTLKNDYAFKRLLGVEENKAILQDFLECVLDLESDEIVDLQLLDKELKKNRIDDKTGILDIQVRLKDGMLIDVEIQRTWNKSFPLRSFAYLAKMYASSLKAGESLLYGNKCVAINIIEKGFNLTDKIHSIASFRLENREDVLVDAIQMHFLNLEKVREMPISKENTKVGRLINWMKIIDAETKEDRNMLAKTSPVFRLLNEKIEYITRSPEEERLFDSRMKLRTDIIDRLILEFEEGRAEGIEEGLKKGREKERFIIARSLLKAGVSVDKITEATGLSEDEIKNSCKA